MKRIYLDYAATSPLKPKVLEAVLASYKDRFANPSSTYLEGQIERAEIDAAREKIANFLECRFEEVIFLRSGTEAINLAIKGVIGAAEVKKPHVITSNIEHAAVYEPLLKLKEKGLIELTVVPATAGTVSVDRILKEVKENTVLVALMFVNNEIGTIQPVKALGRALNQIKLARPGGTPLYFFVDSVQAIEYLDTRPDELNADLLAFSPHKFGGPKGVGVLYRRLGVNLSPLISGGAQEFGLAGGTEAAAEIKAAALAVALLGDGKTRAKRRQKVEKLRDLFIKEVKSEIKEALVLGEENDRAPHIAALSLPKVNAGELVIKLDLAGLAVSAGAACSAGAITPSRVLKTLNLSPKYQSLIRFSFSELTTPAEVKRAVKILKKAFLGQSVLPKKSVAVALSGGVDSAVSALLLKEQGYFVVGFYMRNWTEAINNRGLCPSVADSAMARMVARSLDIPFFVLDFEAIYRRQVIEPFFAEYKAGRTPNPDVLCNKFVKFGAFLETVKRLGFNKIATGHYARVVKSGGGIYLRKGADENKDQSYFLWTLTQKELKDVIFPIGNLNKSQVREIARKKLLPNADRRDSQGICFIGPISVAAFLRSRLPIKKGQIVNEQGQVIGSHDGVWFYTVGQREGIFGGGQKEPLFVAKKELSKNRLHMVPADHPWLKTDQFEVKEISNVNELKDGQRIEVVIRYRHRPQIGRVKKIGDKILLQFKTPLKSVTPGQSAVFYRGSKVLGGGIIA